MKAKPSQNYTALGMIILSALLAGSGQILWKMALNEVNSYLAVFLQPWLYVGILLYILATAFMILAFRSGDLSVLFPILATSFIWVTLLASYLFETEKMNLHRYLGIVFIFCGCCLLGWQQKKNIHRHHQHKAEGKILSNPSPKEDRDQDLA